VLMCYTVDSLVIFNIPFEMEDSFQ